MARPKSHKCEDESRCKKCTENRRRVKKYQEDADERAKRIALARRVRKVYKEEVNAADRRRWHSNPARRKACAEAGIRHYHKNIDASRRQGVDKYHRNKHRGTYTANTAKRRSRKRQATPLWLSELHFEQIKLFYEAAAQHRCDVDHIVPILGKDICGLHVPWNLQVLDDSLNSSKGNKLTKEGEQLAWMPANLST